jgi:KaiC/GvpD/RAD55 family RecA-like ATPase|tara:strand:- start:1548 stop:3341 length:1794 start_codon:yes stop_codon:yes gene_type:complete
MITNENVQKFKSYGFVLTPVIKSKNPDEDKKPLVNKNTDFKWSNKVGYEWSDQELLDASRIGAWHKDSKIFDVDFDDKNYNAHKFLDLLPTTFTVGKKVNGKTIPTHLIYKSKENVKDYKKAQPKVELLANTQTIIAGVDRVIINDQEPIYYSANDIKDELKLIATFSELLENWPKQNRNDAFYKLGGALTETDVPMHQRIKYVQRLCELTNDNEIKNRVSCIERQQQKFDNNEEDDNNIWGISGLAQELNTNLKFFDLIKRKAEEGEETYIATGLTFLNGHEFTIKDYPKPEYILFPIIAKRQIRQVFATAGTGKTLYCLHEACALASGYSFLHYTNDKSTKTPVLYVEGEMDASNIQDRLFSIEDAYEREGKTLNKDYLFFSVLADQPEMHFHSLTADVGRENVEITAKQIEERTGQKPIIYLDNITALTVMQEKEGADWVELMHWLSRLRNKGYHVTFLHHPTKTGETASGSNIKERSIDIDMKLATPDEKTMIAEKEEGHTQMHIEFKKWREHKNTWHSKERIAVLSRSSGKWDIYPMLTKTQRGVLDLLKKEKTADEIITMNKGVEGFSKANVYKIIDMLKKEGVIKDEVSR